MPASIKITDAYNTTVTIADTMLPPCQTTNSTPKNNAPDAINKVMIDKMINLINCAIVQFLFVKVFVCCYVFIIAFDLRIIAHLKTYATTFLNFLLNI